MKRLLCIEFAQKVFISKYKRAVLICLAFLSLHAGLVSVFFQEKSKRIYLNSEKRVFSGKRYILATASHIILAIAIYKIIDPVGCRLRLSNDYLSGHD